MYPFPGRKLTVARPSKFFARFAPRIRPCYYKSCEPSSKFDRFLRHEGDDLYITDQTSTILYDDCSDSKSGESTRPEVIRPHLPSALLKSIPLDTIRWGRKVIQTIQAADGTYILLFKNKPKATAFYLVIGCDGAWFKTHSLFPRRHLILEYPQLRSITATSLPGIPPHPPSLVPLPSPVSMIPKYYAVNATETAPAHTQCYPPSHGP